MISYRILNRITAEDIICNLIRWGYGTENDILDKDLHIILSRYKWFSKNEEEERKRNKFNCPFTQSTKNKSSKKSTINKLKYK